MGGGVREGWCMVGSREDITSIWGGGRGRLMGRWEAWEVGVVGLERISPASGREVSRIDTTSIWWG